MTLQLYRSGGSLFRRAGGLAVEGACCACSPPPNCYCPPSSCYLWVSFPAQLGIPSTNFLNIPGCFGDIQEATGTPTIGITPDSQTEVFPELITNGSTDPYSCSPATYSDGGTLHVGDFNFILGTGGRASFFSSSSRAEFFRGRFAGVSLPDTARFGLTAIGEGVVADCSAWSPFAGSSPNTFFPSPCSVRDFEFLYSFIQGCPFTRKLRQTVLPFVRVFNNWGVLPVCDRTYSGGEILSTGSVIEVSASSTVTVNLFYFEQDPTGKGFYAVDGGAAFAGGTTRYYHTSKRVRIEFPTNCGFKPGFVCGFQEGNRRSTYNFSPTGTMEIAESGVSFGGGFYPWDDDVKTAGDTPWGLVPAEFTLPEISGLIPPPPVTLTLNHRKCEEGGCDCNADISGLSVGFEGKSFTIGTPGVFTERNESWRYQLASGGSEHVFTYKKLACGSYALEEKTVVLYCEAGEEDRWLADVQSICRTSQCDCDASLDGLKILFEGQEFDYGEGQVFGSQEPGGSVWFESGPGQYTRINYSSEAGCTAPDVPVASQLSANIAFCSDGRWEVDFVHICNDLAGGCNPVATDTSIYRWIGILCCDSEGRLIGTPHAIDDPNEPPGLDDFYDPNPENFDDPQCDASTLPEFEVLGPSEEEEEEYGFCENRWVYEFQCDDEGRPFLTVGFSNLQQVDEYPQCSEDASCEVPQPPLFTIQA